MRHTIEFLLCGTISAFCFWRCYSVLPRVFAEARAIVAASIERTKQIADLIETGETELAE